MVGSGREMNVTPISGHGGDVVSHGRPPMTPPVEAPAELSPAELSAIVDPASLLDRAWALEPLARWHERSATLDRLQELLDADVTPGVTARPGLAPRAAGRTGDRGRDDEPATGGPESGRAGHRRGRPFPPDRPWPRAARRRAGPRLDRDRGRDPEGRPRLCRRGRAVRGARETENGRGRHCFDAAIRCGSRVRATYCAPKR